MMPHSDVNVAMEIVNGSVFIVVAGLLIWLSTYMRMLCIALALTMRELIHDPPLGVKLALPMFATFLGAATSLGCAWAWRLFGGGMAMPKPLLLALLSGVIVLILGALWMTRTLTYIRHGEWPWMVTLSAMLGYIGVSILAHARGMI